MQEFDFFQELVLYTSVIISRMTIGSDDQLKYVLTLIVIVV